jgi:hypothetical protein
LFSEKPVWKRVRSKAPELEGGETVEATWVAAIPFGAFEGRASRTGGTLVLTSRRLWFVPLGIDWRAPRHTLGTGAALKAFIKSEVGQSRLTEIARVESMPGKVPRLRVVSETGSDAIFSVVTSRLATSFRTPDPTARDEAVQRISAAVKRATKTA